jgi:hypothetical protein
VTSFVNPVSPERARPASVTISSYLLYFVAATQIIAAIVSLLTAGDMQAAYKEAFRDVEGGDTAASFTAAVIVGVAIFGIVVGAGLVVLAIFNNQGKNASRIVTWVVGGLYLCCGGFGLVSSLGGGAGFGGGGPDVPSAEEIEAQVDRFVPSWYGPVSLTLGILGFVALLAALILLALPPSNEFFRRPKEVWEPPVGEFQGYQAQPGFPPPGQPGYPPAGPTAPPPPGPPPAPPPGGEPPFKS